VPKEQRTFHSRMEIFRTTRPISEMVCGGTLRIVDGAKFTAVWSIDNWATTHRTDSRPVNHSGWFADLATDAEKTGRLAFTMFWPEENRWLGRNYDVVIHAEQPAQMPVSTKPKS